MTDWAAMSTVDEMHRPARIDLAIMRWRAGRAVRQGDRPAVLAYNCYGSPRWVRLLCRVVYSKEGMIFGDPTGSRGWRSFTAVPVENGEVEIKLDGITHTVVADHSGVVDVVIEQDIAPGRHTVTMTARDSLPAQADVFIIGAENGGKSGPCISLRYRIQLREHGGWYACEQQAYCWAQDGLIERIDLLCSGYQPIPAPEQVEG